MRLVRAGKQILWSPWCSQCELAASLSSITRHPLPNDEVERINLPVGFSEDGILGADVRGNDISPTPRLGGEHVEAGRQRLAVPSFAMHPRVELPDGRVFTDEEGLLKKKEAAARAYSMKIEPRGKMLLGKGKAAQRCSKATGAENPQPGGIPTKRPAEASLASAAEQLDHLLLSRVTKDHRFATPADQCERTTGVRLMKVGEAHGERAAELRCFAEDRTQFVFNLTTVEAFTEGRSFKASSGITGPLRDSSIAERKRLRRVCSSISSAVTRRWFFGGIRGA